ncbi:jg3107 [Pararge aegeria aegeria]|uniref:Jg3107 protein n=1 Tax=Pararge aegeria aegeria TaxID=348720 RepID=A0A8S4RFR2_9NEOP|nr:jg3107 [Pararge aegeria aegeria]
MSLVYGRLPHFSDKNILILMRIRKIVSPLIPRVSYGVTKGIKLRTGSRVLCAATAMCCPAPGTNPSVQRGDYGQLLPFGNVFSPASSRLVQAIDDN